MQVLRRLLFLAEQGISQSIQGVYRRSRVFHLLTRLQCNISRELAFKFSCGQLLIRMAHLQSTYQSMDGRQKIRFPHQRLEHLKLLLIICYRLLHADASPAHRVQAKGAGVALGVYPAQHIANTMRMTDVETSLPNLQRLN